MVTFLNTLNLRLYVHHTENLGRLNITYSMRSFNLSRFGFSKRTRKQLQVMTIFLIFPAFFIVSCSIAPLDTMRTFLTNYVQITRPPLAWLLRSSIVYYVLDSNRSISPCLRKYKNWVINIIEIKANQSHWPTRALCILLKRRSRVYFIN